MNVKPIVHFAFTLIGVLNVDSASAARVPADEPDLYEPGRRMPNGCKPSELSRLKKETFGIAKTKSPEAAWTLIHHLICGIDASARRYVAGHTKDVIRTVDYSVEDAPTDIEVPGNIVLPLQMRAWDVVLNSFGGPIDVSYSFQQNVCSGSFEIDYERGTWWIVATDSACD